MRDNQMGLFWEFIRYYNREWTNQYLIHQIGIQYFHTGYGRFNLGDFVAENSFDVYCF